MPRSSRVVRRSLLRKGFFLLESRHHQFRYVKLNGDPTNVMTVTSHGARDISDRLLGRMARELHLSRRQFDRLIDCDLSQADYEALLRRDGFIR